MSSTDGDAITRARAKLVESPQLDELMLLLRDHGRSDSDFFEPSDHEKEKEEGTDEDSPPDGSTEVSCHITCTIDLFIHDNKLF